jgi:predicted ribosome quality control (RQC) complex YloA/Tae2 family protein
VRPSAATARHLARILDERLTGRRIEKIWRPGPDLLLLDVGAVLEAFPRARLLIDVTPRVPSVNVTTRWPETPRSPDRETLMFRAALENDRIDAVSLEEDRRLVIRMRHRGHRLVIQVAGRYPNAAVLGEDDAVVAVLHGDRPPLDRDSPPLRDEALALAGHADDDGAWLMALADACWAAADTREITTRRQELGRRIRAAWAKEQRTAARLEAQLDEAASAEKHLRLGELLKTVARRVPPKAEAIEVVDWFSEGQPMVTIPLDPSKSGLENMELHFKRYRKLLRTRDDAETRLVGLWDRLEALSRLVAELEAATTAEALDALEAAARELGVGAGGSHTSGERSAKPAQRHERLPYRRFLAQDGSEIWLGRSAKDNDAMTFRHARGHDLFLHARDVAGSHVILRARGRDAPPHPEALIDAALLAAWHSKARREGVVAVMLTPRKHVRKGKGMAPGRVSVAATRNIDVRVDEERLARIYARSDETRDEPG